MGVDGLNIMSKWAKYKEQRKQWKKDNPDKVRNSKLKSQFGITLDDYNKMFEDQNGLCAICENPETQIDYRTGKVNNLSVDHDHETGKVRALLCHACNTALGKFRDDEKVVFAAFQYLEAYKD